MQKEDCDATIAPSPDNFVNEFAILYKNDEICKTTY